MAKRECETAAEGDVATPKRRKTSQGAILVKAQKTSIEEEGHFYQICCAVIDYLVREHQVTDQAIADAIDGINQSFRYSEGHHFSEVDLTTCPNACGYLFRHGALGAGLARTRVLEAARNCPVLGATLGKKELRVVSLGGGPGNDLLGFCSALQELQPGEDRRKFKMTVVDSVSEWEECFDTLFQLVKDDDGFGNASEFCRQNSVALKFRGTRLPTTDQVTRTALEKADVILMTKLLSILPLFDIPKVMEELNQLIPDNALILLIDSPLRLNESGGLFMQRNYDYFFDQFRVLYLSEEDDPYSLSEHHSRFGHWDHIETTAKIAVLSKAISRSTSPSSDDDS